MPDALTATVSPTSVPTATVSQTSVPWNVIELPRAESPHLAFMSVTLSVDDPVRCRRDQPAPSADAETAARRMGRPWRNVPVQSKWGFGQLGHKGLNREVSMRKVMRDTTVISLGLMVMFYNLESNGAPFK